MSIDGDVYIKTTSFPWQVWHEILTEFSALDRSEIAGRIRGRVGCWVIDLEDGPIWLDVIQLDRYYMFSEDYSWRIGIHMKSPYTAPKIWHMVAIPYRCLIFIDDVLFYDPYNSRAIDNIKDFVDYAKEYLLRFVKLKRLSRCGFLDEKENILL